MSEKSLFRVLMRIGALALVLYGGYGIIGTLIGVVWLQSAAQQFQHLSIITPSIGGTKLLAILFTPALCFVTGLYLFLGGEWVIDAAFPEKPGSFIARLGESVQLLTESASLPVACICPACGKYVRAHGNICPLCNAPLRSPASNDKPSDSAGTT